MALSFSSPQRYATSKEGVEDAIHSVLFNENIWSAAFSRKRRRNNGKWSRLISFVQIAYDKSQFHYVIPVLVLVAYSILGGYIFYRIESPSEMQLIAQKARYMTSEKTGLRRLVDEMKERVGLLQRLYRNNTVTLNRHVRGYRKFALNQLHKRVYWYALSAYYLTEQETHKQQALRPRNTEPLWRPLLHSNFGRIHALRNYTEQLALRCWEIAVENQGEKWTTEQVEVAVERFDTLTGLNNVLTPVWTFWNAMLLAVTTYTTIGYGNITAKSRSGQLAVMMYAVVGIPLVLMILHRLGRISLIFLSAVYQKLCRLKNLIIGRTLLEASDTEVNPEIPLPLAIGVAFGWMFLCAAIYQRFEEDWDYFKSFYFFFCSLTTIGYGDVTPTNSEDLFVIAILLMFGLSLVSMCINVIQLKLEKLFEELVLSLMEEYNADPEARQLRGDKIGMIDMWRVWKKRKNRLRDQAKLSSAEAQERIAKVLPFARRRERRALIREMRNRLKRLDKATQTENIPRFSIGCEPIFAPDYITHDRGALPYITPDRARLAPLHYQLIPPKATSETVSPYPRSPSSPISSLLFHVPAPPPPLPPSVSPPRSEWGGSSNTVDDDASNSLHSIPKVNRKILPPGFDPGRRWTFIETGQRPRGMPRGLVNPLMYSASRTERPIRKDSTVHLLAEIDNRLVSARELATPSPYTSSDESLV